MKTQFWFASCPRGLESLLLQELESLGASELKETVAGCSFQAPLAVAYRVSLWTRLANRVLLSISEFPAEQKEEIHAGLMAIPWEDYLPPGRTFVINFSGQNRDIRNTQFGAQLAKDAIVDRFRERGLTRPAVDRRAADVRFQVRLHRGRLAVSLDFAGASLHQRGYRLEAGKAPLKENLAAAMLLRADWPGIAARGGALIDPMCGSGTLLLEAAMMIADVAPGLHRQSWGFETLQLHNPSQWQAIRKDAQARAERGKARELPEIRGYDAHRGVVDKATANIERAGLERHVRVSCKPVAALKRPTHRLIKEGLLICNPPYGERLGERESLPALYRELGDAMLREFPGWNAAILTSDKELGMATGLRSHRKYTLYNGAIPSTLLLFELREENRLRERKAAPEQPGAGAEMFANRMRKNLQQADRWARKQGISCYRVYDADMPEYAVAVDRYGDALHVAEYKAPASVDEAAAERRLGEILQVLPGVTGVPENKVYFKQRRRQRGEQQYQRQGQGGDVFQVSEGRARLLVNLSDYLDTGLFLDHRPLRLRLAEEAAGKNFLNLFCYTATASVHAALGGATSTTSVDLSNTYLEWARKNFECNGLDEGAHQLLRADCLEWLEKCDHSYDLILLDPPSFSNSKRMEVNFDVQRDHPVLLRRALERLSPGGVLYFSNNLRSFKLDPEIAQECELEDISRATIDFDFRRNPHIHRCWRLSRK
jgi:23S rRNA (guanine2445-N2)-methyltransferase / 23S rRNA (guanine2069-N7)-methyltransferase